MGWAGLQAMQAGKPGGPLRPAINDQQTMVCPASEFVAYYKRALAGEFFRKKETLTEFKRIQSMADAIPLVVPADTPAYAKGGSISWDGFYCLAVAGQMIVGATPVTFCLTLNWTDARRQRGQGDGGLQAGRRRSSGPGAARGSEGLMPGLTLRPGSRAHPAPRAAPRVPCGPRRRPCGRCGRPNAAAASWTPPCAPWRCWPAPGRRRRHRR